MAEFFSGIGLMRAGLEPVGVDVVWANDIEPIKARAYLSNYPQADGDLVVEDICHISGESLPGDIDLATSSFPCTDLSLAGKRQGLAGRGSGMFWQFLRVLHGLPDLPRVVLLENVRGFVSSNDGKDLSDALRALSEIGYSLDILAIDSRHFVPQSRLRLFVVGIIKSAMPPGAVCEAPMVSDVRPSWVVDIFARLGHKVSMHYVDLPSLPDGPAGLETVLDANVPLTEWWAQERVEKFVGTLSDRQFERFEGLLMLPEISYRAAYRRTRNGVARWELRRDGISGCLRTPGGGSSRQAVVRLGKGENPRIRWMTPREYAGLMGARDYKLLVGTPIQQIFGFGDAVVVDVVRWVGENYLLRTFNSGDWIGA